MRLHEVTEAAIVTRDEFPTKRPEVVGSSKTLPSFTTDRQTLWKRQLGKGEARKMTFLYRERTQLPREVNHHACEISIGKPTLSSKNAGILLPAIA